MSLFRRKRLFHGAAAPEAAGAAGWAVLAVLANVALIVTLASVWASSSSQCGYGYAYPCAPVPPLS